MAAYTPYLPSLADAQQQQRERGTGDNNGLDDYEDEDLLRHLGFTDDTEVTDDELRDALARHQDEATAQGADDLVQFYALVHQRFFPSEEEEEVQDDDDAGGDDDDGSYADGGEQNEDGEEDGEDHPDDPTHRQRRKRARFEEPLVQGQIAASSSDSSATTNDPPATTTRLESRVATSVIDVPYQRGTINPLERKTFTRLIQLDSQTRDPNQLLGTNYLFDLGEKLRNVVKISLYAITIPYHWYTVGNAFGSNFFYLVPTAPGLTASSSSSSAGPLLLQVRVEPGNYSAQGLVAAVQAAMQDLPARYPSVAFNGSTITQSATTGRATLSLQFQNTFEDPFWVAQLYAFSSSSSSAGSSAAASAPFLFPSDPNRLSSLSAYLGFNRPQYNLSCAYSQLLPSAIEDTDANKLFVTTDNQTITIVHYTTAPPNNTASAASASSLAGTGISYYVPPSSPTASDGSPLLGTPITLLVPVGTYTQRTLMKTVNDLMAAEPRINMAPSFVVAADSISSSTKITAATTPSGGTAGTPPQQLLPLSGSYLGFEQLRDMDANGRMHALYGQYRFVWSVRLHRSLADPTAPRAKIAVLLPDDPVWVNSSTGLNFASTQLELQTTRAETPLPASNYIVPAGTFFRFRVAAPNTLNPAAFTYDSAAVAPRTTPPGYSLAEYLSALNAALQTLPFSSSSSSPYAPSFSNLALISPADGRFQLRIDFALSLGSSKYTFVSDTGAGHFFAGFLGIAHSASTSLADGDTVFDDSTFDLSGGYSVAPGTVLFQVGVSAAGTTAGVLPPQPGPRNVYFVPGPTSPSYTLSTLLTQLQISLAQFADADGARLLAGSALGFDVQSGGTNRVAVTFTLNIAKNLTESDLVLDLFDAGSNGAGYQSSSWYTYLKLRPPISSPTNTFQIGDDAQAPQVGAYRLLSGASGIESDVLTLTEDTAWSFPAADDADDPANRAENRSSSSGGGGGGGGNADALAGATPPRIVVPAGQYTRPQLFATMNRLFAESPELAGSALQTSADALLGTEYCLARWSVHRAYGPESYRLLFYSTELFQQCVASSRADYLSANVVPTQTLGWTLGFHTLMSYDLDPQNQVAPGPGAPAGALPTYVGTTSTFTFSDAGGGGGATTIAALTGDATINVNPYATLYLTLDDFFKNRTNDTVVTIAGRDTQYSLPSGTSRRLMLCDPATGDPYIAGTSAARMQTLTRNALYANAALLAAAEEQRTLQRESTTTNAAFVPTDTLAILPLKLGSTSFGQTFTENSGSLMVMNRAYRGPITLARGRIQLLTDRGVPLDLNGQNWSVTLVCEMLASPATLGTA